VNNHVCTLTCNSIKWDPYAWHSLRVTAFLSDLQAAVLLRVTRFAFIDYRFWLCFEWSCHFRKWDCYAWYSLRVTALSDLQAASDHIRTDWLWVLTLFWIIVFSQLISQYKIVSKILSNGYCCLFFLKLPIDGKLNCKFVLISILYNKNIIYY